MALDLKFKPKCSSGPQISTSGPQISVPGPQIKRFLIKISHFAQKCGHIGLKSQAPGLNCYAITLPAASKGGFAPLKPPGTRDEAGLLQVPQGPITVQPRNEDHTSICREDSEERGIGTRLMCGVQGDEQQSVVEDPRNEDP